MSLGTTNTTRALSCPLSVCLKQEGCAYIPALKDTAAVAAATETGEAVVTHAVKDLGFLLLSAAARQVLYRQ